MRRLTDDEDGAIAVMVGILLVALLGCGAIAVDVAALFSERRELQNGADAAVFAVAQDCAKGDDESACDTGPQGDRQVTAQAFANRNATDNSATVPDPDGVDVDYPGARASVETISLNAGEGFVRHWFAPILGVDSTVVNATATAIWGPLSFGSVATLPLTFSKCEYDKFLAAGAGNAEAPWTSANNGTPQTIFFHGKEEPCNAGPSGKDLPGGFGWLETPSSGICETEISDSWVGVDPGAAPSQGSCSPAWMKANVYGKVIVLPVFIDDNGKGGNNAEYRITTYAAFYVTGYNFGGQYKEPSSSPPCKGSDNCIAGWFTTAAPLDGVIDPSAPDNGVRAVQLVRN